MSQAKLNKYKILFHIALFSVICLFSVKPLPFPTFFNFWLECYVRISCGNYSNHLLYNHFFSFFKSLHNTSTKSYSWNICLYLLQQGLLKLMLPSTNLLIVQVLKQCRCLFYILYLFSKQWNRQSSFIFLFIASVKYRHTRNSLSGCFYFYKELWCYFAQNNFVSFKKLRVFSPCFLMKIALILFLKMKESLVPP